MSTPNEDVFSCIFSHIHHSKTVHAVLRALPQSHPLFSVALHRLWELPVYLDNHTYEWRAILASDEILDHLLAPDTGEEALAIVESIRHLVIAVEPVRIREEDNFIDEDDVVAFRDRLSDLFEKTRNLKSIDYHSYPGIPLSRDNIDALATCERLRTFSVDAAVRPPWTMSTEDPEPWNIEPSLTNLAPSITSLELRHVCLTTLTTLASHGDLLATYENLEYLKMDITEGYWDWSGAGSPQTGASDDFIFPSLQLPALRRLKLVVSDLTIHKPRAGPLDLVDCTLLTDLTLDIRSGVYLDVTTIQVFMATDFPMLSHLEIKDNNVFANYRVQWEPPVSDQKSDGRRFHGLVERFLGSTYPPLGRRERTFTWNGRK
ncbi:hypothetical protein C8F04DRAFT_385368 [Mycena alexandri]|uniref:Uncharacterized protein n=1 Tax=Mycena alexandri TaxID=1745969 RepID=A0AAD6T2D3_9AGAR|nr:hypothetical protein C8F04DRAFT_385368 [Mycena alexandri]